MATSGRWLRGCILVAAMVWVGVAVGAEDPAAGCARETFVDVGGRTVWRMPGKSALFFRAGMAIDADGAPNAYHPEKKGIDHLGNAGRPGNWWALVTDNGKPSGTPVRQGPNDPFPGFYISTTALQDASKQRTDPGRYVDSRTVPYVALPPAVLAPRREGGARLGDFVAVMNLTNDKVASAIVADIGPKDKLGEGSIALAEALGIPSSPRTGGVKSHVAYGVFPRSGNRKPRPVEDISKGGALLLAEFGGAAQLSACSAEAR